LPSKFSEEIRNVQFVPAPSGTCIIANEQFLASDIVPEGEAISRSSASSAWLEIASPESGPQ
jgi:hypothetical protein